MFLIKSETPSGISETPPADFWNTMPESWNPLGQKVKHPTAFVWSPHISSRFFNELEAFDALENLYNLNDLNNGVLNALLHRKA